MDDRFRSALAGGLEALGLRPRVSTEALERLERFADRLLVWNRKVNLTAITEPEAVAEKHLVDSLALLPDVEGAGSLLDIGSGGGIPGIPIACVDGSIAVTCCDAVAKKIAFVKAVSAELDVNVRAIAVRAEGRPDEEGLPRAEVVVSRAFTDADRWLPLGRAYLADGGRLLAMLGKGADERELRALSETCGLRLAGLRRFRLPRSGSDRAVAKFVVA